MIGVTFVESEYQPAKNQGATSFPRVNSSKISSKLLFKINKSNLASYRFAPVSRRMPKILDEKLPKVSASSPNFYCPTEPRDPVLQTLCFDATSFEWSKPYFKPVTRQNLNLNIFECVQIQKLPKFSACALCFTQTFQNRVFEKS